MSYQDNCLKSGIPGVYWEWTQNQDYKLVAFNLSSRPILERINSMLLHKESFSMLLHVYRCSYSKMEMILYD